LLNDNMLDQLKRTNGSLKKYPWIDWSNRY
jgi:hypothetical protein